ncbi:MAG: MOSC domain-containing protein [Verrucomicrobia bacterium]|nr:MOSC domain-containing protein [Verrucomicrobiota bacterium]
MFSSVPDLQVTRLIIYPVKGLAGQQLPVADVLERGLAWDRRWMLVDDNDQFLSQRQIPDLATIEACITGPELLLRHRPTEAKMRLSLREPEPRQKIGVTIWRDQVEAVVISAATQWFSDILQHSCRLVFMPDSSRRGINPAFARSGEIVGFADAYPMLLVGEASLFELNARLAVPVPMNRFRPNIVVSTKEPFIEDQWGELEIGSATLRGVKASDRCSVPTVDQATGKPVGPEPIRTLNQFRRVGRGIYFGQNLAIVRPGRIALKDPVIVKARISAVYA